MNSITRPLRRFLPCVVLVLLVSSTLFAATEREADVKIGFSQGEDRIVLHEFVDGNTKILLVGEKYLQLYEVRSGKQIYSVEHGIRQFTPGGFFSRFILLGLPQLLRWRPFVIDPDGKWLATIERVGERKLHSVVIRDIRDAKPLATLEYPDVTINNIRFDAAANEFETFGTTGTKTIIAKWDATQFSMRSSVSIDDHKWHQFIAGGERMLIGSGDTRFNLSISKEGETLSLYDVRKGENLKNFSADGLRPRTSFTETATTRDEKYLISRRDDRYFLWEIDGNGSPRFEFVPPDRTSKFNLVLMAGGQLPIFTNGGNLVGFDPAGDGKPLFVLSSQDPKEYINVWSASDDGEVLVVGSRSRIRVISLKENGQILFSVTQDSPNERLYPVTFMQGQNQIAIGRNNRKEKKEFRSEIYDLTGKLVRTTKAPILAATQLSPDLSLAYTESVGAATIWNIREDTGFNIPLETYTPTITDSAGLETSGETINVENTALSADRRRLLKYGGDLAVVFDVATGEEIAILFDKEGAKYDKRNKVKNSGLSTAGWVPESVVVFAYSKDRRTLGFWNTVD